MKRHHLFFSNSTRTFNSTINNLSSLGAHNEVIKTYFSMLKTLTPTDTYTYPSLIKACTSLQLLSLGLSIHHRVIVNGFSSDSYISTSLINFYATFGYTEISRKLFDVMPERDVVHWSGIIRCYSRVGDVDSAFTMFNKMRHQGTRPSSVTILGMLSGVFEVKLLQCLHGCSVLYGFVSDVALSNSLLNVYCKYGGIQDGRDLFEEIEQRDLVSWNTLISGYAQIGNLKEILHLLCRMRNEVVKLDHQTYGSLVSAIAMQGDQIMGRTVHGRIIRAGIDSNAHVKTSLIAMYLKCSEKDSAIRIFESIPCIDDVSWTVMISGLVQNNYSDEALFVFSRMLKADVIPSTAAIACALAACAQLSSSKLGASIHGYISRQEITLDIPALNSLVTTYAKCASLKQSLAVFERMNEHDLVSWNAIISGYAQNGHLCEALCLFNQMRTTTLQRPDSLTVVSLLQACVSIGSLDKAKLIHTFAIRSCIRPCIMVDTALVDMYSKCGDLKTAQKCFDAILLKDLVSWTTIIGGYGFHGKGEIALIIYNEFLRSGLKPNHVIFLSILSCCSHNGLVSQGLSLFSSMVRDFGLEPKAEHCACVVDLLCRAGQIEEAYDFYKEKFSEPVVDVLGIILDACRFNHKTELGDRIGREVLNLKSPDAGSYVQLANCYASMDRWDEVSETLTQMRALRLKKLPGWSFIELHGTITTFFMDHNSHPHFTEVVSISKTLNIDMRKLGTERQDPSNTLYLQLDVLHL